MKAIVIHQYGDRSVLSLEQIAWFKNATIYTLFMERNRERLDQLANLANEGILKPAVGTTLPLADAARAHEMLEGGHVGGKIVLAVSD